jgi:signal transduction histidine kinase
MSENDRIILSQLAKGIIPDDIPKGCEYSLELNDLILYLKKIQKIALDLTTGDLGLRAANVTHGNLLGSLKSLHANLRHLTWQLQCVAHGDLSQRLDYMGEFSKAFNQMLDQLIDNKKLEIERQELEKLRHHMNKEESLTRMAGAVAHHFNNILTAVIGNIDLALSELDCGVPINHLRDAMRASRKAANLSQTMLVYLGQTFAQNSPIDIVEVCQDTLSILSRELSDDITFSSKLPPSGKLIINGNAEQLQIMLRNLIVNAYESYDKGAQNKISLAVRPAGVTDIPVKNRHPVDWSSPSEDMICMEIMDSGTGIPEDQIEKIFDPFFSTKFTGRGLGLAVTLGIVRAHNGVITVESTIGRGTAFTVFLPSIRNT